MMYSILITLSLCLNYGVASNIDNNQKQVDEKNCYVYAQTEGGEPFCEHEAETCKEATAQTYDCLCEKGYEAYCDRKQV